ncbi:Nuclear pore complex Nup98-Nup96 [Gossypium arboreum]|uniref:Nuclear pore complex Nup98-Nup96 n=1 Tax=Gossypium arboreum TaxID=29729 RepID=A0A0B0PW12_GOSAR|nr:Nuclear pore complex Nup98-Nup96 [Gossypium arboreum]
MFGATSQKVHPDNALFCAHLHPSLFLGRPTMQVAISLHLNLPLVVQPPFAFQTGSSIFGGSSTEVFGAAQFSSPFLSTTAFGASSSPAFGSSMPAFGSSSSPAFGSSSASFGGSSVFGQKPAFGFGSTPTQSSPFGITACIWFPDTISQSAFGSSTSAFAAASTPAFGVTSTPAFGSTGSSAFGSTGTAFGVSNSPVFGTVGTFGASSAPAFGTSLTHAFGASNSAFGTSKTPVFGVSSSAFGVSDTPSFGSSSTPSFSSGSSPAFGQSTPAFASSPFGTTTIGAQGSFGPRCSAPAFGQSTFGAQRGGSRVASYPPTIDADSSIGTQPAEKLESISAMPVYKDKSHEELRWEDYQLGDKVGLQPTARPPGGICFGVSTAPTIFISPLTPTFGTGSSLFSSSVTPSFPSSPSIFGTAAVPAAMPAFATGLNFSSSQASPLFNSTPAIGQVTSTFGQNTGSFDQTSILNTPSTGFCGNMFSSPLLLAPANNPAAFGPATASRSGNLYYHSSFLSYL